MNPEAHKVAAEYLVHLAAVLAGCSVEDDTAGRPGGDMAADLAEIFTDLSKAECLRYVQERDHQAGAA